MALLGRTEFLAQAAGVAAAIMVLIPRAADAVPDPVLQSHRALYTMSLESAQGTSGVDGASGSLYYEWGDACDGWTLQQRYKLKIHYQQDQPVELSSNFVTWESKDGRSYRFNERELRNGTVDADIRGSATLRADGKGGFAIFQRPKAQKFTLPSGTLFPTAHTIALIRAGLAGKHFVDAHVFDGSIVDGSSTVAAVLNTKTDADATFKANSVKSALLKQPSWQSWLSFFSDSSKDVPSDYTLGMQLLKNGVSSEMTIDYGDYVVRADLQSIEPIAGPAC